MKTTIKDIAALLAIAVLLFAASCGVNTDTPHVTVADQTAASPAADPPKGFMPRAASSSPFPDLQAEILDGRFDTANSPLGTFDFKNFTYPLPRGWQNPDGSDLTLVNGHVEPVSDDITEEMSDEEKSDARSRRRIGMSYVTTNFLDLTGDGQDEAVVVLKVETTGAAIPQLVYVYEWKDGKPELIWNFRTGDRADGGLKDIRFENGETIVELYGQDRFLLGQSETSKITGDEEQLCCPTHFTRTAYKWNGKSFSMQGKRLTFAVNEPNAPPLENLGDIMNDPVKSKKYLDEMQKRER